MSDLRSAVTLMVARLQRVLVLLHPSRADLSEFRQLSDRLAALNRSLLADGVLTEEELERIATEFHSASRRYDEIASRKSGHRATDLPETADAFRAFSEAAQIHYANLAGRESDHFRAGLLADYRSASNPGAVAAQIALDIVTSASTAIAISKLHLLRAAMSLEPSEERRRELLSTAQAAILSAIAQPVWKEAPIAPALDEEMLLRHISFGAMVSERRIDVPLAERNTNRMFPNRPIAGWEEQNSAALGEMLNDLSRAGALFVDRLHPGGRPLRVAMKIELNMGIEGPPSVTDPVLTGATLYELLERAYARGIELHFIVGDSCGIENAAVGRTSMDIMRETGNFHHALKAGLRLRLRRDQDPARREAASAVLGRLVALETAKVPVFFASPADRVSSPEDIAQAEELASPWVACVDYDAEGFISLRTDLGPLGLSLWGSRDFQVARSWVEADHRVHVTRGCSTHLFAGWTGSLKGLVGLHALGLRPADQGLNELGQTALGFLSAMMHLSGFHGIVGTKAGLGDVSSLLPEEHNGALSQSRELWRRLSKAAKLVEGWKHWVAATSALERELRAELRSGTDEPAVLAKMRRLTRAILDEADGRAPGFRDALWAAVYEGTRSGLLTGWRIRSMIPANMRDARMGMRIGVLAHLPLQAELVVQGLPKIGIGGGPDAYEAVHDVGVLVAGTDEISVDLAALRAAGVPGNPWQYNWPIHGALQLGRGPALWDEIKFIEAQSGSAAARN